jgi:hypothetical protein
VTHPQLLDRLKYEFEVKTTEGQIMLVHSWSIFGARTSHGQTRTHKTHHDLDLGEATTFPFIVYFVPLHKAHIH